MDFLLIEFTKDRKDNNKNTIIKCINQDKLNSVFEFFKPMADYLVGIILSS